MESAHDHNLAVACIAALLVFTGCMDPATVDSQAQALRSGAQADGSVPAARLLILDEDAIDDGCSRNRFSRNDVNDGIASVGLRKTLPFFDREKGKEIVLPAGRLGDEGWFALKSVRVAWRGAGPDRIDGLRNYLLGGPGLGSPDSSGRPESLLERVPNLVPLRTKGLQGLVGKAVCAVVMDRDVRINSVAPLYGSLRGLNLGKAAFEVLGVGEAFSRSSNLLPVVRIRVLDADMVCDGALGHSPEAPAPLSYCERDDADGAACRKSEVLLDEPWDAFDPDRWAGLGDERVADGHFSAVDGAASSAADWIQPCPIRIDSSSAVKFANRVRFDLPEENDFAESGALFFVSAGEPGSFDDYVFLNLGYTVSPSKVFVEMFGAEGGIPFDSFLETEIGHAPSQVFNVELWADHRGYRVGVNGEAIDTVDLENPIGALTLFEVGVQQNGRGLRGLIDRTTIGRQCATECKLRPRKKERSGPRTRCLRKEHAAKTGHGKSDHRRCHHAKSKDYRDRHGWKRHGSRLGSEKGSKKGLSKAAALELAADFPPVANPCGRNDLIRMARGKVAGSANPPVGLIILSRMEEVPGCGD
jgi:hypothetical protein